MYSFTHILPRNNNAPQPSGIRCTSGGGELDLKVRTSSSAKSSHMTLIREMHKQTLELNQQTREQTNTMMSQWHDEMRVYMKRQDEMMSSQNTMLRTLHEHDKRLERLESGKSLSPSNGGCSNSKRARLTPTCATNQQQHKLNSEQLLKLHRVAIERLARNPATYKGALGTLLQPSCTQMLNRAVYKIDSRGVSH